uniref:Protein O-GlcNAc transferase n=1 Tax=Eutreptiella gymnastica TaxID=73025 RepID=A0A7S1NK44_9EUGL
MAEAHLLYVEGKYSKAIKGYTSLINDGKAVSIHLCNRAQCYLQLNMGNKAMKDADEALKLDPDCTLATLRKAEAYMKLSKAKDAHAICMEQLDKVHDVELYVRFIEMKQQVDSGSEPVQCTNGSIAPVTRKPQAPTSNVTEATPTSTELQPTWTSPSPALAQPSPPKSQVNTLKEMVKETKTDFNEKILNSPAVHRALQQTPITHGVGQVDLDKQIALGYYKVNNGLHQEAISHFGDMLAKQPNLMAALLGRGTALALVGHYAAAETDFSRAISLQPNVADSYKRRSQVLGVMGKSLEAIQDLTNALHFEGDVADTYFQRASLLHKMGGHEEAHGDIQRAIQLDGTNKTYFNLLGLVLNCLGDSMEAVKAYERAIALDPRYKEAICSKGQAYRDWGMPKEAMENFLKSSEIDPNYWSAHHLRGFLNFSLGNYNACVKDSIRVVELDPKHRDALYLLALSYHNLGQCRKSVETYDKLLRFHPGDAAWYNRECCLILHHHFDVPMQGLNWDQLHNPYFKEAWCKRSPLGKLQGYEVQAGFKQSIPDLPVSTSPLPMSPEVDRLIQVADVVGSRFQLETPGFLPNVRQHRTFGLAALEVAQVVADFWQGNKPELGWRQMINIIVKWRQLSEVNDPVWWIDLLPHDLFHEGFGLQTPMLTGQLKVPRYYPYFDRCFSITKRLVQEQHVLTDEMAEGVCKAQTCPDLWAAMHRDFFVISPCHKLELQADEKPEGPRKAEERGYMEGTRITLVSKPEDRGFQFTIRTPGTPDRYKDYSVELEILWERMRRDHGTDRLADHIVSFYFFWVNFQPLTRGSAACGLVALFGLFLAAGEELTSVVKKGMQTDWEGITTPRCEDFLKIVTPWLYPNRSPSKLMAELPSVAGTLVTVRDHLLALNHKLYLK